MVAAGGLAAALSTADGLLLTIANALSHDLYYKMIDPNASTARRVTLSKALLLVVALARPAWRRRNRRTSCSWCRRRSRSRRRRSSRRWCSASSGSAPTSGAPSLGMIAGLGITFYYMATTQPWMRGVFGVTSPIELWWGIQPISAGLFGVPLGFAVIIIVSLMTPAPRARDAGAGGARALPEPEAGQGLTD